MSLIQDALKKAQELREKERENGSPADNVPARAAEPFFTTKRKLVYGIFVLVVVIAVVLVTVVFKPTSKSSMKSLRNAGRTTPGQMAFNQVKQDKTAGATTPTEEAKTISRVTTPPVQEKSQVVKGEDVKIKARPRQRTSVKKKAPSPASTADELMHAGDQLAAEGNFVLAVDRYKKALKSEKKVSIYLKLYSAFRGMQNRVLARAYIEEGIKNFPDSFALNKVGAIIHIRAKEFEKALEKIDTALLQKKSDYMLLTYKGLCLFHKKNYKAALVNFKGSLDLNADASENYYYIGLIYDNVKNYRKALEFYKVFFSLNPEDKNFKHRNWVINRIRTLEKYLNRD